MLGFNKSDIRPSSIGLYEQLRKAGKSLLSLIALALNLDENYFENVGVLDKPMTFLRIIHYRGTVKLHMLAIYCPAVFHVGFIFSFPLVMPILFAFDLISMQ